MILPYPEEFESYYKYTRELRREINNKTKRAEGWYNEAMGRVSFERYDLLQDMYALLIRIDELKALLVETQWVYEFNKEV